MDDGTMETAALRIGCKVNLTLRITGVRPNGWHELDTVFLPLDEPSDTLRLALRPGGGLALHCAEPGIDPENNTLTKAYRLFAEASGFRPGVEAVLEKGIPHGAGLGGGSADAAALLGWLNARAPEPLPLPELVGLAAASARTCRFFCITSPAGPRASANGSSRAPSGWTRRASPGRGSSCCAPGSACPRRGPMRHGMNGTGH